jgi:Arc/MetJ-type ribon-helix-helix transcriptional regulator
LNKNLRITIRVEDSDREQIEALIKAGKFKSLSQVVREALKQFLEKQKEGEA